MPCKPSLGSGMENPGWSVLNHKGGVGKTATVSGLASGLKQINPNYKILIIDADEQANIKTIFGIKLKDSEGSLASVLMDNADPNKCVINVRDGIDVILSGGRKLRDFNVKLANFPRAEEFMNDRFKDLAGYDFILIDCPPALSLISSNVVLYASYVLIPTAPDLLSIVATKATVTFLDELDSLFGHAAEVLGAVDDGAEAIGSPLPLKPFRKYAVTTAGGREPAPVTLNL